MDKKCIDIKSKKDCCGCRNCENICPKHAIKMVEDEEGFLYPMVDKEKCVNCGLCRKVCPWLNEIKNKESFAPICYAIKNKDKNVQKISSSGGAFGVFANAILEQNGYVCASIMNDSFIVSHSITDNKKDLVKMYGSKYVISDLKDNFLIIRKLLNENKKVLFCGVPCQVNALLNFLQKNYENLYTIEIICHGVPSQKLFSKYIEYLEKKDNCKVLKYEFRNKKAAYWGTYKALATVKKNEKKYEKKINADLDKYYSNFLKGNCHRESCYVCKYAKKERNADITIGDFWGIEHINPNFIDKNGVSEIIINTKKGEELFEITKNDIEYEIVNFSEVIKYNKQLESPCKRLKNRNDFYKGIDTEDYFKNVSANKNIKSYLKIFIPSSLKIYIKKRQRKR